MPTKLKLNFLFFILYLAGIGQYFLTLFIGGENIVTRVNLVIDFGIILSAILFSFWNNKYSKYVLALLIISTFTLVNSGSDLFWHFNGLRSVIVIVCCFIILESIYKQDIASLFAKRFITFAYVFLCFQIPISVLQFLEYGPGDKVSGTIGQGGSGVLTFTIFILIFILLESGAKFTVSSIDKVKGFLRLFIFFIPVALNETKITFVLLGLFFLSFLNFKKLKSSLMMIVVSIGAIIIFSFLYSSQENVSYENPLEGIYSQDFLSDYLLGDKDQYEDVPRITKIILGTRILSESGNLILGEDYGAFTGEANSTEFKNKYEWLLKGSRPLIFFLLISGGLLLTVLLSVIFIYSLFSNTESPNLIRSKPLLNFLKIVFMLLLFYNDGFRYQLFSIVFISAIYFSKNRYSLNLSY